MEVTHTQRARERERERECRSDLLRHSRSWTQERFAHKREKVVGLVGLNFERFVIARPVGIL